MIGQITLITIIPQMIAVLTIVAVVGQVVVIRQAMIQEVLTQGEAHLINEETNR